MCGFAGVVAWDDRYRVSRETLGRMSASIAHRGPDGEGYHINHEGEATPDRPQVALAFRRLAILDPDPRSNQPFTDGRHWLVFNGEIYNFRELREELRSADPSYEWRTSGDTEVLLRAYAVWGAKCVERLNGMFAFAVWDERERALFLARDRMGQKPLYWAWLDGCHIFASENSAAASLGWMPVDLNDAKISHYLACGYLPGSTQYKSLLQVLPGECMRLPAKPMPPFKKDQDPDAEQDGWLVRRYFDCNESATTTAGSVRPLIETAVKRQLVSDVPLGVFLSGGIDSSVIAACARRFGPVKTFAIGFNDPRYSELEFSQAVSKHLGTEHHEFVVTPKVVDDLPKLATVFGEPFADSSALPTHYLARETRQHVKVALSGDGGDELFGGYERYRALHLSRRLSWLAPLAPLGWLLSRGHPKQQMTRAARFLGSLSLPEARRYDSYLRIFDDRSISRLLGHPLRTTASQLDITYRAHRRDRDPVQTALATDRETYLPNDLLTKVDRCSMLHALEVRSPFMDHELVQFAAGLTTDQLLKGGPKRMLREAFAADLPDFVFKRKKMGFAVPIGEWFRGELRPMLRDHLFATNSFAKQHFNMPVVERLVDEHEQSRVDHSQRLYALLMLELWWRLQTPGVSAC